MSNESRLLVEDDVFSMTYDKLRKELKKKRLSAAGKKSELQFRLVEFIQAQKEAERHETINEEEGENQEDAMETDEPEEPANRTFTVEEEGTEEMNRTLHEGTPTNAVELVLDEDATRAMCADLGVDLHNFEVKSRTRTHRSSGRQSLRAAHTTPSRVAIQTEETPANENRGVTPSRQIPASRGIDRFALLHAKEMDKQESLGEHRERVQKRHEDLTSNVPESIRRLATPKSAKTREPLNRSATRSASRAWQPQNPTQMTFKFGDEEVDDFSELAATRAQNGECSSSSVVQKKPNSRARAHRDVKQLARIPGTNSRGLATPRSVRLATRPDDSTFVDYMSTPKGSTPSRQPKRGGYTPFAGKKVFVDTTSLTDREYNLALEEGLIPGKKATKTAAELRQMESKKRRDDIIALKRKLNVN